VHETPLIYVHEELGASLGIFAGWRMPIDYGNPLSEALKTRQAAAVFDISHLTKIEVSGEGAYSVLQRLVAKDISKLPVGTMLAPTAFLNEAGGFVDDVSVYRLGEERFLIIGNAINWEKDVRWLEEHADKRSVEISDVTADYAMIAVQGPLSGELIGAVAPELLEAAPLSVISPLKTIAGEAVIGSRSGWTGEEGYEIIARPEVASALFDKVVEGGAVPAGLGARDILRIEMGFCLYGREIDEETNPIEARYWVFSWRKRGYVGCDALLKALEEGVKRVRVGFVGRPKMPIPRRGVEVYAGQRKVGVVTSGTFSPMLGKTVAMGLVDAGHAIEGLRLEVRIRGKRYPLIVSKMPFLKGR